MDPKQASITVLKLAGWMIAAGAAFGVAGTLGFFGALRALEAGVSDEATPDAVAPPPVVPAPDARPLDQLLAEGAEGDEADAPDAPPAPPAPKGGGPDALSQAIAAIRGHKPLNPTAVGKLGCEDAAGLRNLIWTTHGYALRSAEGDAWMTTHAPDLRPDRKLTLDAVEIRLQPMDRTNRSTMTAVMRAQRCPCAAAPATQPCPE
jgi:hypothetical protein